MGTQRTTFAKLQREKAKKAKAAAKRERRQARSAESDLEDAPSEPVATEDTPAAELMDQMATLHERYDDGAIDFDDFEEQKAELLARLALTANS